MGKSVAVSYSVTINKPDAGDKILKNVVTLPPGENSNCTAGSTDPACGTVTPVGQYTVVKKASASSVKPGDSVRYTITVTNTGQLAYTTTSPATFTDNLADVLDDATYNNDATSGAKISGSTLTWSGALPIAGTATISYSVAVNNPDTGNGKLHNVVTTPTDPAGIDPANCPTGTADPNCSTNTGGTLPFTGSDIDLPLILGSLLIGVGGLLMLAALRRRRRTS